MQNPPARSPLKILVIGQRGTWPEPLSQHVAHKILKLDCVKDIHEAAGVLARGSKGYVAMLIDPEQMSGREMSMLSVVKHHIALPIWSLPSARKRSDVMVLHGILPWEETVRALAQILLEASTPQVAEGSKTISQGLFNSSILASVSTSVLPPAPPYQAVHGAGTLADNKMENPTETHMEIPVASDVAARYDGVDAQPLLSELEIRALLGPSD